jgi:hypothetical protein
MNIYVIVEGEITEKIIYKEWIPCANNNLSYASKIEEVTSNKFYILSGRGFPQSFDRIKNAIKDVLTMENNSGQKLFHRLVVSADSEEESYAHKRKELTEFIENYLTEIGRPYLDYKIIVQHFCIETWGLGNSKIIPRQSKWSQEFKKYMHHFNIIENDPELLESFPGDCLTKAQHAANYLRQALIHRGYQLTYTKGNPSYLANEKYYNELKKRFNQKKHIKSFNDFLVAFI